MVLTDDLTAGIETVVFAWVPALRARAVVVDERFGRNFEHGLVEGAVVVAVRQGSEDTGDVDGAKVISVLAITGFAKYQGGSEGIPGARFIG
ncbi:MAG: hypothetical protein OXI81_01340 [Paracoccaceae bacterium]|nr:hypothetical protein [Paracoccaceae bacterium]